MKLWRGAFGALRDQHSIWMATLSRRTALRNPEIQIAVIKATSHDDLSMDTDNIAFLYKLLKMSSVYHKSVMFSISMRMAKTRSWVVALKGLILVHGIFACKIPAIQKAGILPFDLSDFQDGRSKIDETWAHNRFIRSYYAFLNRKSAFLQATYSSNFIKKDKSMKQELEVIQKLQGLLNILFAIIPETEEIVYHPLFVEAIDCVIAEVFDVYSQICRGISKFDVRNCSVDKVEAAMALEVIQKATIQGEELSMYLVLCREIGVLNPSDCPVIQQVSKEDVEYLEDIIDGGEVHEKQNEDGISSKEIIIRDQHEEVSMNDKDENSKQGNMMMTIITNNWETFDEDLSTKEGETPKGKNPFEDLVFPMPPPRVRSQRVDIPDLISL